MAPSTRAAAQLAVLALTTLVAAGLTAGPGTAQSSRDGGADGAFFDIETLPPVPCVAGLPDPPPPPTALLAFGQIRGANYFPWYSRGSFRTWRSYAQHVDEIDAEIALARRLGLNSLRVFLSYLAYELDPEQFLADLADFQQRCEAHGLTTMLVLFDSAFGVAPSPETRNEFWTTSPGSHLVTPAFYPDGERYVDDVMAVALEAGNVLVIDVMNEPWNTSSSITEAGALLIWDFLCHFTHYLADNPAWDGIARTIGFQVEFDYVTRTSPYYLPVNAVSLHSYSPVEPNGTFLAELFAAIDLAESVDLPLIVSECGIPGVAVPQAYEDIMPPLHGLDVSFYYWDLMIGTDTWKGLTGVFYPDGEVRSVSGANAILGAEGHFEAKGPEEPGYIPLGTIEPKKYWIKRAFQRMTDVPTNAANAGERFTLLFTMATAYLPGGEAVYFLDAHAEAVYELVSKAIGLWGVRPAEAYVIMDVALLLARQLMEPWWLIDEYRVTLPVVPR